MLSSWLNICISNAIALYHRLELDFVTRFATSK